MAVSRGVGEDVGFDCGFGQSGLVQVTPTGQVGEVIYCHGALACLVTAHDRYSLVNEGVMNLQYVTAHNRHSLVSEGEMDLQYGTAICRALSVTAK